MKQKIQKIFSAILLSLYMLVSGVGFVSAQSTTATAGSCAEFAGFFTYKDSSGKSHNVVAGLPKFCSAGQAIAWVIERLLYFAGAVAVITIMLGGFWYLTSAGNDEQAEKGRKTLTTSIIGLIIVIMAATIVRIVANTLTEQIDSGGSGSNTTQSPPVGSSGTPAGNGGINPIIQPGNGDGVPLPTNDIRILGGNTVNLNDNYSFALKIPTVLEDQCSDGEINLDDVDVFILKPDNAEVRLSPNGGIVNSASDSTILLNFISNQVRSYGYTQPQTLIEGQFRIRASVCGSSADFNVQIQGNSSGGSTSGGTPPSVTLALQNSSYTLTPYASETAYTVNITMPNTSQESLCANATSKNIQLIYKGNVVATESVTVRQLNINSVPPNFISSDVQVKVCGYTLNQQ